MELNAMFAAATVACSMSGTVASGKAPLPGVVLSVTDDERKAVEITSSSVDGSFAVKLPGPGHYTIKGELVAFASVTREVPVDEGNCSPRVDLAMSLASRTATTETRAVLPASAPAARGGGRTFQPVALVADQAGLQRQNDNGEESADAASALLLPPGFSSDTSAESVTAIGGAQSAESLFDGRGRFANGFGGDGPPGAGSPGGPGGPGGNGGGRGGGAFQGFGPNGFGGRGGPALGRGSNNQIRGSIFESVDTSVLDAAPFALNGQRTGKPDYLQQRFGATIGGPLGRSRTFFFLNYTGNHARNPYDAYSTVPTAAERDGDFSSLERTIVDPITQQPFAGNQIPESRIDPAARALVALIPTPNQSGDRQNFHTRSETASQNATRSSLRERRM